MALYADHALLLGELEKIILEILVSRSHDEAFVHVGTVLFGRSTGEKRIPVDFGVEQIGLFPVYPVDSLDSAYAFKP